VQEIEDGEFADGELVIGPPPAEEKTRRDERAQDPGQPRQCARASTGPQTTRGRARAARNALRHALSLPVGSVPALSEEVEALAGEIAGPGANAATQELARRVAEAQINLRRVRYARHQFLSDTLSKTSSGPDKLGTILSGEAKKLLPMDRYERRALSRRKFAIRAFDEARRRSSCDCND
jgi:hypothetical protein